MTAEMQTALTRELDDAQSIDDPERRKDALITVQSHMLAALIDCQKKTADRVKSLAERATAAEYRLQGAQMLWRIFRYVAAAGGGAAVLKLLQVGG